SGQEPQWIEPTFPLICTARMESWQKNHTYARRVTFPLRISSQKLPAATLSLSALRNRQLNARTGRWCMVSVRRKGDFQIAGDSAEVLIGFRKQAAVP